MATAVRDVDMLAGLELPTTDDQAVLRRSTHLSIEINHHLFDTLYHAVTLEHEDALLVTADERYYRKAERYGTIAALSDWPAVA
jgi:predicted nucleic acid-binding protein